MNTSRPLILVVDDVTKNIQVLGNFLREEEYDVAVATSGTQALMILENVLPDLILLDIMMPGMDGFETCRRIKALPGARDIPIVFVTAKTDTGDILRGLEMGAVDYITKPFNRLELLARVHVHVELKRSREALAKALFDKDKFFSIIAHDLRGPIGSFMSISEYLSDNLDEVSREDMLPLMQEMRNTGRGVYRLLENLLDWSRIQIGTIAVAMAEVPMADIIDPIAGLLQTQAAQKSITLEFTGDVHIQVHADPQIIGTVLRNLVQNAIKYTPRGGSVIVAANASAGDSTLNISVIDTGVGMSSATVASLFDIAKTKSTPGTEKEKGTGLGLILCKELISLHGGSLHVSSEPGRGSIFSFSLQTV